MSSDSSGDQFAHIARTLSNEPGVTATLEHATATALAIVDNCDHASISLVRKRRRLESVASTDDTARRADQLQVDLGEGPVLQSLADHETIHVGELGADDRWPRWADVVSRELGIESVLVLQLFVGTDVLGSLNLYSGTPKAFGTDQRMSALALAAHVAVAVLAAQDRHHLESALVSRTVIGQAEGRLMQRLDLTADQAFAALVRISQAQNRKLHDVADDIVAHGIRPELFG